MKPNIVISECINLKPVRYNGGIVNDEFAKKLSEYVNYIPVCPEVAIGMGVPRNPVILIEKDNDIKMIDPQTQKDYTDHIIQFSQDFLKNLKDIDGFLLKSKSPSCGVKSAKKYIQNNKVAVGKINGLFAQKVVENFPDIPVEDEGRLKDNNIRRNFLVKIFSFSDLRYTLQNTKDINQLIDFHKRYKYLLMLYNQTNLKKLGQLVANWKKIGLEETKIQYETIFKKSLHKTPSVKSHINVLQHIYGYFSKNLSKKEKEYIQNLFEKAINKKIDISVVIEYIKGFAFRFENEYLMVQKYFEPYPQDLNLTFSEDEF